jgi:hypothetical protein
MQDISGQARREFVYLLHQAQEEMPEPESEMWLYAVRDTLPKYEQLQGEVLGLLNGLGLFRLSQVVERLINDLLGMLRSSCHAVPARARVVTYTRPWGGCGLAGDRAMGGVAF